ncbi:MAG: FAD-dependent oxidoreductase [Candidatus Nitrosotenuis sp.]
MAKFDIAIIGGGILGTAISYWLSALSGVRVCVLEKEVSVAAHASGRNTGVVHSPFYLDPQKKKKIATASLISHSMWKKLASNGNIPWNECGTIEVALDEAQHKSLEKYVRWGQQNGIPDSELKLLDASGVSTMEPNVKCHSGLYCTRDVSTDFGALTYELYRISEDAGTKFIFGKAATKITASADNVVISLSDQSNIECDFMINCAGGHSLDIAKKIGLGINYTALHFRGEYWVADKQHANLVNTNVYSVAKFSNFPFLDPHWIKKANGQTEIGPNAVPVSDAEAYSGYIGSVPKILSKLKEILSGNAAKLLVNQEFLSLVSKEWKSSLSKSAMVNRVKEFIPAISPSHFTKKGTAGIRSPIVANDGKFVSEILELESESSLHIINYNSPGATGAPAYAASLVDKMQQKGLIKITSKNTMWDYSKIIENMP